MLLGTFGRVLVLAAIVLIAGAGVCPFDRDEAASDGFCLSFLQTTSGLPLTIPLALTGRFFPGPALAYDLYPPDLPAPPPKA